MAIHIKPENRGKFTAAANKAGKGVQEYASQIMANKDNYSPTLVKRANFAKNAAGWKKALGGLTDDELPGATVYGQGSQRRFTNSLSAMTPLANRNADVVGTTIPNQSPSINVPGQGIDWAQLGSTANSVIPYASNILNASRRPPMVPTPNQLSSVTLRGVDYSADRADVTRAIRGADMSADRALDGNTSQAVRAANLSTSLGAMSRINQAENNANTEISNRQNLINSDIERVNLGARDQYNRDVVERGTAIQREQSANIANAADKYIMSRNESAKRDLDRQKAATYESLFRNSGVMDRNYTRLSESLKRQGFSDREIENMILMGRPSPDVDPNSRKMGGSISGMKKLPSHRY